MIIYKEKLDVERIIFLCDASPGSSASALEKNVRLGLVNKLYVVDEYNELESGVKGGSVQRKRTIFM